MGEILYFNQWPIYAFIKTALSVSFQFGFIGQQPAIGYQLIRYGDKENRQESYQKGLHIIDFWVRTAMTDIGAPQVCYNPTIAGFEPMPFWTRMIADGLENILDAYVFMKKKGEDKPTWLEYCRKAAHWFVHIQNEDGSWYRAYNINDGSMRMDPKANTISIVRFLIQLHLVTGSDKYKLARSKQENGPCKTCINLWNNEARHVTTRTSWTMNRVFMRCSDFCHYMT